ncbi:glycosyltransferase family 50 protein [Fomitopsis serialis]|uniref:glycosyltransferase family 50 protein n=1 Tax=Fomitopsis serialis TaxID=139415 RepID=UPI00200864D7|nr:glycosyltransferase family 50 protein [Neoantrodia serialis]KAH9930708.1 glycosyltransferase family 50 protein [Neoantrodia serialis]
MEQRSLARLVPSFNRLLAISTILRVVLILYSEWHDAHSVVKYTDVDYRVFSDAARFLLNPSEANYAQGPLGTLLRVGDPYTRATYRYTPLLAVLLTPNEWLHPSFGKYMFAAADIVGGVLMYKLLTLVVLPKTGSRSTGQRQDGSGRKDDDAAKTQGGWTTERYATALVASHLLNPLVFTISTRGSSESVLSLFVLSTLYCALKGKWNAAAVLLGLSTHWKIYPFIYGVACLGVIGGHAGVKARGGSWVGTVVNTRTVKFTVLSLATFVSLGTLMYAVWGYPFLYESYLYHLHRLDHRHNFSPYFYLIYLTYTSSTTAGDRLDMSLWIRLLRSPLTSFVPQMVLSLGAGLLFGRRGDDLVFAWFVQTVVFVVFNKVCTSQYFLWYMLFLPLLIPRLRMSRRQLLAYVAVWVGTQALWLSEAYKLEFLGQNVFFGLWIRSLMYVVGNCWVLAGIMRCYTR